MHGNLQNKHSAQQVLTHHGETMAVLKTRNINVETLQLYSKLVISSKFCTMRCNLLTA